MLNGNVTDPLRPIFPAQTPKIKKTLSLARGLTVIVNGRLDDYKL